MGKDSCSLNSRDNRKFKQGIYRLKTTFFLWVSLLLIANTQAAEQDPGGATGGFKPVNTPVLENAKVNFELTPESTELLGDGIDLATGAVSFSATDVSIPGNFALDVALRRRHHDVNTTYRNTAEFADWGLDIPSIQTRLVKGNEGFWGQGQQCTPHQQQQPPAVAYDGQVLQAKAYWGGLTLSMGQSQDKLLTNDNQELFDNGVRYYTKSNIVVSCYTRSDGTGQGFKALSTDGTAYYFDVPHQVKAYLPSYQRLPVYNYHLRVSKVVDRFGNTVTYNYNTSTATNGVKTSKLTSIQSSDGRSIHLFYEHATQPNLVTRVVANNRTWYYTYTGNSIFYLTGVTLPDGRSWAYGLSNDVSPSELFDSYLSSSNYGACEASAQSKIKSSMVLTHPNGVKGEFYFESQLHGTTNTPSLKEYTSSDTYYGEARCFVTMSLVKKVLTGPGINYTWLYNYSENPGSYDNAPGQAVAPSTIEGSSVISSLYSLSDLKTTTITSPDTSKTQHVFYRRFNYLDGTQVATRYFDTAASGRNNALMRTVLYKFEQPSIRIGGAIQIAGNIPSQTFRANKVSEDIKEHIGATTDTYTTTYSSFNDYGTPLVKDESNTISTQTRRTVDTYDHDRGRWVLHLLKTKQVIQNGVSSIPVSYEYYSDPSTDSSRLYLPKSKTVYGSKRESYDYHATEGFKGQLSKVGYPELTSPTWVSYTNYKRGKPQNVTVPHRYNAGITNSVSMVINDSGTIASVTDFNGYTTSYGYDSLDRVTTIDPPGDYWSASSIEYNFSTAGYAVVQTLKKGSYAKVNYYDGLLHIVKSEEGELVGGSFTADTRRVLTRTYNHYGKPTFESRPSSDGNSSFGTTTEFDGLQRVVAQTNTANGNITTSYLASNTVKTTNGRNYETITDYIAFGAPSTDLVRKVTQPGQVVTSIQYNEANLPTQISQGGTTESRVYTSTMDLCLQKRPETGIKAMTYNNLGLVERYAEGLSGNGTHCTDYNDNTSAWVTLSYDRVGDVKEQSYADGNTPTKTSTLDPQGNILTLANGPVVWTYQYNSLHLPESQTLQIDQKTFSLGTTYNAMGFVKQKTYPGNLVIDQTVNALGNVTEVKLGSNYLASAAIYHPDGQLSEFTYGNGLKFKQTLDTKNRPYERQVLQSFNALLSSKYQYDNNNNIESITDVLNSTKTLALTYDSLDRLWTASAGNIGNVVFGYDALGNITQKQVFSTINHYTYDATTKRLSSAMGYSFGYDSRGNVTSKNTQTFTYNRANQLVASGNLQYAYDGYGRRVKQLKGSQNIYSLYDAAGQLAYRGNPETTYTNTVYLGKQLLAELDSSASANVPQKPVVNLGLSTNLVTGQCNLIEQWCETSRNVTYGWSSTDASSCQGQLIQTTPYGAVISSMNLSGTSQPSTTQSYPATDALYTLTVTCTGPGGSTTESRTVAGTGAGTPGDEM